jgi:hypothetical protein
MLLHLYIFYSFEINLYFSCIKLQVKHILDFPLSNCRSNTSLISLYQIASQTHPWFPFIKLQVKHILDFPLSNCKSNTPLASVIMKLGKETTFYLYLTWPHSINFKSWFLYALEDNLNTYRCVCIILVFKY